MNEDYARGWRAAGNRSPNNDALGRADDRNEPREWYDGYMDHAAGRPRGHLLTCTDRDRHESCWEG